MRGDARGGVTERYAEYALVRPKATLNTPTVQAGRRCG